MSLLALNIMTPVFFEATGIRDFTLYPLTHFRYLQNSKTSIIEVDCD